MLVTYHNGWGAILKEFSDSRRVQRLCLFQHPGALHVRLEETESELLSEPSYANA